MTSPTDVRLPQRRVEHCMGTVFSFDVRSPGVDGSAVDAAVRWLHWVDATFSTYRPSSQISRLASGALTLGRCAPEVREILGRCAELEAQTHGYFSAYAGGSLDPSGLVKGWAIQRASEMLAAAGSANHCVNGGGDVQCAGSATPQRPWQIGIAHPLQLRPYAGIVAGRDFAVATSGSAERGAHIVAPHARSGPEALASVSVIGRELATADAYATAAFAMGPGARDWVETLPDHRALIVYADGTQWASGDLTTGPTVNYSCSSTEVST
jgi:thiamine biosynthesis lipoprotein